MHQCTPITRFHGSRDAKGPQARGGDTRAGAAGGIDKGMESGALLDSPMVPG